MFFYLSKLLYFVIQPLSWIFLLLLLAIIKKKKRGRWLISALTVAYIFSCPLIYRSFAEAWEYPTVDTHELTDTFEVAIVLGGIVSMDEANELVRFNENADRVLNVLPFYFNGQVKKLLIAGGSGRIYQDEKEAKILGNYLIDIGVDSTDLLLETRSRNTFENALKSKTILDSLGIQEAVLLSTSAMHMRRSIACFDKLNVNVVPFSVDEITTDEPNAWIGMLAPSSDVLSKWYRLIHEWVGINVYRMKGYC